MKLLDREFLSDFFRAFLVLVVLLSIIHLVDTLLSRYEDIFGDTDNGVYWGIVIMISRLPGILVDLTAVAVSAAILWVVTRKARQNEILAWLSGGVSPLRLSAPFLFAGVIVAIGAVGLTEWIVGPAERHARYVDRIHFRGDDPSSFERAEDIFQKGIGERFYVIGEFDAATARMSNPHIVEFYAETRYPEWQLEASSAYLEDEDSEIWVFENAQLATFDREGGVTSLRQFESVRDVDLLYPMETRLKEFLGRRRDPDHMGFLELWEFVSILKSQGKEVSEYTTRLHAKLALPLGACIVALVICGHVMRPRSQGVLFGLGGGLLWVIGYYGIFFGFQHFAQSGVFLSAVLATWLPNVVFGIIGVVLMLRTGR